MLGFQLLDDGILYKAVTTENGQYIDRKWVSAPVTSITTFQGDWEPYRNGEDAVTNPQGVSDTSHIVIYSQEILDVSSDLKGFESKGDLIYLKDPDTYTNEPAYRVIAKEDWVANTAFTLLKGHIQYIAIRQEKT